MSQVFEREMGMLRSAEGTREEVKERMRGRLVFMTLPTGMKQDITGTPQTLQPRLGPVQTSNFTCAELNARVKCM